MARDPRGGIDERSLRHRIRGAQRGAMSSGLRRGREATRAAQGAGVIEAGKLFGARGMGGGLEEALRGSMSASQARALGDAEARRKSKLLADVEGIGTQMLDEATGEASKKYERELTRASEAGTGLGLIGSLGGLATGASGALSSLVPAVAAAPATALAAATPAVAAGGPAAIPLLIGGLIAAGVGAAGKAAAEGEAGKAREGLSDLASQRAAFDLPSTAGLEQAVSFSPGYEGFSTSFLGGQGDRRRRDSETPYADALGDLNFYGV